MKRVPGNPTRSVNIAENNIKLGTVPRYLPGVNVLSAWESLPRGAKEGILSLVIDFQNMK